MGWLHNLNLKRKVAGVLAARRGSPQSVAAIASAATADEREVVQVLDALEQTGYVLRGRVDGLHTYQLNEAQGTIHKVLHTFQDAGQAEELGMMLHSDDHGWTAELSEPAGLLVHGKTREEARERDRAMMRRLAALPDEPATEHPPEPLH